MYPCVNCLNINCVELRTDRKGRPYTSCRMCSSRTFMHSATALRGLAYWRPQLAALHRTGQAGAQLARLDAERDAASQITAAAATAVGG